jgi:membrane protein implicated in regulation of membrane protease activity
VIPLAHFGHWYVQLIFAAPVLVLVLLMGIDTVRKRRAERKGPTPPE